jgi:hypothetical protein
MDFRNLIGTTISSTVVQRQYKLQLADPNHLNWHTASWDTLRFLVCNCGGGQLTFTSQEGQLVRSNWKSIKFSE